MKKYYKLLITVAAIFVMLLVVGCDQLTDPGTETGNYTVTFDSNGGTAVTAASVESGKKVTKPTNPTKKEYTFERGSSQPKETNYVFIGWYIDSDLTSRFDFNTEITEDKTLYAKWQPVASSGIAKPSTGIYAKTEEVYVITPDKTGDNRIVVKGSTPSFIDSDADDNDMGVFWEGRNVKISPFIMSRYEVTQELYEAVIDGNSDGVVKNPWKCTGTGFELPDVDGDEEQANRPVEYITWYDALYFCNQLSAAAGLDEVYTFGSITVGNAGATNGHITSATVSWDKTKNGYRLPTEAEWEFAARGGNPDIDVWNYEFSGASTSSSKIYSDVYNSGLDSVGWYGYNTANEDGVTAQIIPVEGSTDRKSWGTHETGSKAYNELGLFDMSGNVAEWCFDTPLDCIEEDPDGAGSTGTTRAVRGGSWFSDACDCVVTSRKEAAPNYLANDIGLRVVRSVPAN